MERSLQKKILIALQEVYPDSLLVAALPQFSEGREFMGNLFYLQEHGLIEGGDIREPGQCRSMVDAQITKDGLDFLENDGGLDAILGVAGVTIDGAEVESAILAGIEASTSSNEKVEEITQIISEMSQDSLKKLIVSLVERGAAVEGLSSLIDATLKRAKKL